MAKFPDSSPRLKKTTSDTAYLSDSLQGQLLHKVNFISFFQMFVLQNWATNATIKKSLIVIYYINIPKQTITVADLEILYWYGKCSRIKKNLSARREETYYVF